MRPEMTLFVGPKLFSMKKAAGALWVGRGAFESGDSVVWNLGNLPEWGDLS